MDPKSISFDATIGPEAGIMNLIHFLGSRILVEDQKDVVAARSGKYPG